MHMGLGCKVPGGAIDKGRFTGQTQFHLVNHLEHRCSCRPRWTQAPRRIPGWDHTPLTSDMLCCITSNYVCMPSSTFESLKYLRKRFWLQSISAKPPTMRFWLPASWCSGSFTSGVRKHRDTFASSNATIPPPIRLRDNQYVRASICISPLKADPIHIPCMHKNIALAFSIILIYKSTIAVQNAFT